MAEKPSELNNADQLDPLAMNAGAGSDPFVEKYVEGYPEESERREMAVNTGEHPPETEHLKAKIEETRNQMGETIDAIQERLSFSNISDQVTEHVNNAIETAKDSVYQATVGKAVHFMKNMGNEFSDSQVVRTARNNPFPLVLIGLGAGLLAYNAMSGKQTRSYQGRRNFRADDERWNYRTGQQLPESAESRRSRLSGAKETLGNVTGTVSNAAGSAYDGVSSAVGSAYEGVSHTVEGAYSGATDAANRVYERAGEFGSYAYDQYDHYLHENPLAVGAVAAAVGAAIGLAIPSTRYEDRLMGEAREQLLHKVQDQATGLIDRAKSAANEAGKTINEEVKTLAG